MIFRQTLAATAFVVLGSVVLAPSASAGVPVPRDISGTVFEDHDGDGIEEAGDTGIAGCTVTLDEDLDDTIDDDVVTDANGAYLFEETDGLVDARVAVTCPGDVFPSVDDSLEVPASPTPVADVDFGFFESGRLFGDAFSDLDRDGVRDAGEAAIDGCTISFDGGADGNVDATDVTQGGFDFSGLRPATFRLRATCPGLVQTSADPADFVVVSGSEQGGIDFGFATAAGVTTATTAPTPTTAPVVLARTGAATGNGPLGLLGVALLLGGAGLVTAAARRRAAA